MTIQQIGILSLARVLAGIYATLGLVVGTVLALFSLLGAGFGAALAHSWGPWLGTLLGIGAVVALPTFYGILGFLLGTLVASIYNLVARLTGGLEIELTN